MAICGGALSVVAQQPQSLAQLQAQPRIVGLETNSHYMNLLGEDHQISRSEDSISLVVVTMRRTFRDNPQAAVDNRDNIILLENQLFELRARKAVVVDSLNLIEQEWVLNNMNSAPQPQREHAELVESAEDVKFIYESSNVKGNLSGLDYKNLIKAEQDEVEVEALSNTFTVNYDNMLSLKRSYEVTPSQSEAIAIKGRFDSLAMQNVQILGELKDRWGNIYDNKSFAYSMLMELLDFPDVLSQEAELMRKAQTEISAKQGVGSSDEQLTYLVQKCSMLEFEILVAETLGLSSVADTLRGELNRVAGIEKISLPELSIEERLFILYEPIEIVSTPLYSASNPIPQTVIYDKGVVFRIFVGSFKEGQTVATFRNATPLSTIVNSENRHCYYIGGFATLDEAEAAQAQLKKHGFRAPQVVVWSDGRERNLTKEPLSLNPTYRIDIANAPLLPEGGKEAVQQIAPRSTITKVGTDKFVIMNLERSLQVDSLVSELQSLDSRLVITIDKSEAKIEF